MEKIKEIKSTNIYGIKSILVEWNKISQTRLVKMITPISCLQFMLTNFSLSSPEGPPNYRLLSNSLQTCLFKLSTDILNYWIYSNLNDFFFPLSYVWHLHQHFVFQVMKSPTSKLPELQNNSWFLPVIHPPIASNCLLGVCIRCSILCISNCSWLSLRPHDYSSELLDESLGTPTPILLTSQIFFTKVPEWFEKQILIPSLLA